VANEKGRELHSLSWLTAFRATLIGLLLLMDADWFRTGAISGATAIKIAGVLLVIARALWAQKQVRFFQRGMELQPKLSTKKRIWVAWSQVRRVGFQGIKPMASVFGFRPGGRYSYDVLQIAWSHGSVDIERLRWGFIKAVEVLGEHLPPARFDGFVRPRLKDPRGQEWVSRQGRTNRWILGSMGAWFFVVGIGRAILANQGIPFDKDSEPHQILNYVSFSMLFLFLVFGLPRIVKSGHEKMEASLKVQGPAKSRRKKVF
jgi:hypothetical protein